MFCPNGAHSVIPMTGTSIATDISSANPENGLLRLFPTDARVHVAFGDSTVVATTSDPLLANNLPEIFKIPVGVTHFAVVAPGNSVYYWIGEGA